MSFTFVLRNGTTAQWAASNRVLLKGEPGFDTDLNIHKFGDGINTWANLPVSGAGTFVSQPELTGVVATGASNAADRATVNAEAAAAVARIAPTFLGKPSGVYVGIVGTTYYLLRGIGEGRYTRHALNRLQDSAVGNYPLHQLQACGIAVPLISVDEGAGTFSAGWTSGSNAAAYGGAYRYATVGTANVTWTSPADTIRLGLRVARFTNGGYGKVALSGGGVANLLPTAQDEVTAGRLASTALVANGGTLNPTDRVISTYGGGNVYDDSISIADGLAPAAYTITYTATGYGQVSTSGTRAYLSGFMSSTATTAPTDTGVTMSEIYRINSAINSAWEYAMECKPAGATTATWVGNVHGYEVQDSIAVYVDGSLTTLTDSVLVSAVNNVEIVRASHLLHPETGSTVVANVTTRYVMDRNGLAVTPDIQFVTSTTVRTFYAMMPLNGAIVPKGTPMDRSAAMSMSAPLTQTGLTFTRRGSSRSAAAWLWGSGGKVGALMWLPDAYGFTENWSRSIAWVEIEDRPPGTPGDPNSYGITKVYVPWVLPPAASLVVPAGYQKKYTTRYVLGYFPNGAEATLAAI